MGHRLKHKVEQGFGMGLDMIVFGVFVHRRKDSAWFQFMEAKHVVGYPPIFIFFMESDLH